MSRITFEWTNGYFRTDCTDIAQMFVRSPQSFNPKALEYISSSVCDALQMLLLRAKGKSNHFVLTEKIERVKITVEEARIPLF